MKRFLMIFLSLMIILALPAYAQAQENLISNGDFSQLDANGLPDGWSRGMWFTDIGVSQLYVDENGYDGNCIVVVNADANDARFEQTLSVEPDSLYRFSCMVKAEGCGSEGYGATLSFENTFSYSDSVLDTNGEWRELTVYGQTGSDQTEIVLMARIGGYGMINTGRAWFDNIEACKVDSAPEGAVVVSLKAEESSGGSTSNETVSDEVPDRNTETYLLMGALYGVLILALMRRACRLEASRLNSRRLLVIGLGCAFVLRLVLSVLVRGYNTDINCFSAWSERMFAVGPTNFYAEDYFCDYPPGYMLLLGFPAAIRTLFGFTVQGSAHLILLKLMPVICDLLGAWIIWRFAERRQPASRFGVLLALIYAFNPAVFIDSAAWGQIDSVFTLFVVLCAIKAADENYIPSLLFFALAMLIKPQAMLFAPLGLFAIVVFLIRRRSGRKIREFIIGIGAAVALIYAVAFIFCLGRAEGIADALVRPVEWIIALYGETMGSYSYLTINALNLYCLLDFNWAPTEMHSAWTIFAWCMFALSYLYSFFLCAKSKKQHHLLLAGAVLMVLIFTFGPMIHERYIYPALLLLSLACILERDRRLLISLTLFTITAAMNEILVLQGGMGSGNYGHLQDAEQWLNGLLSLVNVIGALHLCLVALDICVLGKVCPLNMKAEAAEVQPSAKADHKLHLNRRDVLVMAAVTLIYSLVAFVNLGSTAAPQTTWISSQSGENITFDLGRIETHRMTYYGGICNSTFTVELSNDGETWTQPYYARYDQGEIFRWLYYVPMNESLSAVMDQTWDPGDGSAFVTFSSAENEHPMQRARYIRITAQSAGLRLSEVGFWSESGQLLDVENIIRSGEYPDYAADPQLLIDEQHTVPEAPSYFNSTYFDEIYHARTAYEMLHGESVYEWTHPPLGKVLMMIGIQLFGMTPFGWRFMGALIGVLMLPLMYLLTKQLSKSTLLSSCAMCLMALDSMHFTQTRIATIDSYAVFWIMLMYLFMIRYIQMDWKKVSFRRSLIPLGLCGITMGIAIATKWIGCYAAVGLAVLLFWKLIRETACAAPEMRSVYMKRSLLVCAFCVLFFVVIPVLIYYFSHYWQLRYEGVATFLDMFDKQWINRVVKLQKDMLGYHAGLGGDTHYFRSPWYQWPIIWWPMWYYSGNAYMPDGVISSISCMGNPAVWWSGLAALIFILVASAWKKRTPRSWLIVLIGFASQFLPWVLVPRSTFIYHYFASIPFIILCTVLALRELRQHSEKGARWCMGVLLVLALVLFAAFYPLESGLPISRAYAQYLRWFKWYNF